MFRVGVSDCCWEDAAEPEESAGAEEFVVPLQATNVSSSIAARIREINFFIAILSCHSFGMVYYMHIFS